MTPLSTPKNKSALMHQARERIVYTTLRRLQEPKASMLLSTMPNAIIVRPRHDGELRNIATLTREIAIYMVEQGLVRLERRDGKVSVFALSNKGQRTIEQHLAARAAFWNDHLR